MLTRELIDEFNEELKAMGCSFRYKLINEFVMPAIEIEPVSMMHIDSYIINITDEFRNWMRDWFKKHGEELRSNNTGSILWSYKE